jgi:serine/threonine protein kinase
MVPCTLAGSRRIGVDRVPGCLGGPGCRGAVLEPRNQIAERGDMAQTFHRYRAGDKPVGGYKLIRKLGEGGFGEVWQACAPGGAEVALKFIDLTGQQGFREFKSLRLVKKITHNNLTPLHGFWLKNEDGTLIDESDVTWSQLAPVAVNDPSSSAALATAVFTHPVELIVAMGLGKKSLYDRLRECKDENLAGIPADELLEYMEDAARGIDYLNRPIHDMGQGPVPIVHSDVKPHNILIVGDGAQVCDFGLAHAVEALRKTCAAPLTLAYAAPESFRGKPSDKSDQYSLAITYVELRTGALPFDETLTGYEVMTAHVQGQLDYSRLLPGEESVIRRATSALPQDRWRNCREMVIELRKALRLSTDSNFMPDAETIADAQTRKSGPPFTHTMMPPGTATSETAPYSGLTPTDRDPALRTRTPQTLTPRVVSEAGAQAGAGPRRKVSTRAKLLVLLLILAVIGGAAAYPSVVPHVKRWFAKEGTADVPVPGPPVVPSTPSSDDRIAFYQLVDQNRYDEALTRLKAPAFTPAQITEERAAVLELWRPHARSVFHRGDIKKAAEEYQQLVNRYPEAKDVDDFKLMRARSLLTFNATGARQVFATIAAPDETDSPRNQIYYLVKLLTRTNESKEVDRLGDLYAAVKRLTSSGATVAKPDIWTATESERKLLDGARTKTIADWLSAAETRPAKDNLIGLTKIVDIDPSSVDALVAKADAHWELNQPKEVVTTMALRAKLKASPRPAWLLLRAQALDAYTNFIDPKADEKALDGALGNLPNLLSNVSKRRELLAAAAVGLAKRDSNYASRVVVALRHEADSNDSELRRQFIELLKIEIPLRLSREQNFADAADQLRLDCELIVDATVAAGGSPSDVPEVIRACHAECLLQLGIGDPKQVFGPPGSYQYSHYVRALVYADRLSGDPKEVNDSLRKLFSTEKPSSVMLVAGRSQKAMELLDRISDQANPLASGFKIESLLKPSGSAPAATREMYAVLKNAYRWSSPSLLSLKSKANLAVAAWLLKASREDDGIALARDISKEVADAWSKNKTIPSDDRRLAFALYYTLLASRDKSLDKDADRVRVEAGQKLIELASEESLDAKDAAALYSVVLESLEPLAKTQHSHAFFSAEARLIAKNAGLPWGFPSIDNRPVSVSDKLEDLYSEAIDASGRKIGEYFKARAELRAMRQPPDHVAILADVGELKNFPKYAGQALAMEGFVYFLQSREERGNVAKRYEKLQLALKSLIGAEKLANDLPKDDLDKAYYIRSLIHTERGNLAALADARERIVPKDEFKQAISYAEKVIEGGGGPNLQFAYEAAANAYEDLAWHARVEPEKNFAKAIEHLTNSVALNRNSPAAHMALARSYYKMIVEAGVNRKFSRENLGTARRELEEAIKLAGDGQNAEAHLWLAKVIQATHVDEKTSLEAAQKLLKEEEYDAADAQFTKAYLAAEKARFGEVFLATYAYARAEHALFNPRIKSSSGGGLNSPTRAVHDRANQLAKLTNGRTVRMDPVQEARILRAAADVLASSDPKMPVKALENLDEAAVAVTKMNPDDLTRSDVKLIEFRLGLQEGLRPHQLTSPAIVQSAVRDAIWYSKAEASLPRKEQALLGALKLSQQMAIKSAAYVAATAPDDQTKCLQRIIALKTPAPYDYYRHLEVIKICGEALIAMDTAPTANVNHKLRAVTRAYVQSVITDAARLKRPATETATLNKMLAAVPPPPAQ